MLIITITLALLLIGAMTYAGYMRDERDKWVGIANAHVTNLVRKEHTIEQHELTISMLMDRELAGTWLPNVDAEILEMTVD